MIFNRNFRLILRVFVLCGYGGSVVEIYGFFFDVGLVSQFYVIDEEVGFFGDAVWSAQGGVQVLVRRVMSAFYYSRFFCFKLEILLDGVFLGVFVFLGRFVFVGDVMKIVFFCVCRSRCFSGQETSRREYRRVLFGWESFFKIFECIFFVFCFYLKLKFGFLV